MARLRGALAPRAYQTAIAESALAKGNTLVVLPTGLGKTLIALLVMEKKLEQGRVLFLSPTKPLAEQHAKTISENIDARVALLTGEIKADERRGFWGDVDVKVIVATPQTVKNDVERERASLSGFSLCVFDEAHRAVKNYAYTYVAGKCHEAGALVLGLTASPGGSRERIEEVGRALGLKNFEIRSESDSDVLPYVIGSEMKTITVKLPDSFGKVLAKIEEMADEKLVALRNMNHLFAKSARSLPKKVLFMARERILNERSRLRKFIALSKHAALLNLIHAHELLETQGRNSFLEFFKKMQEKEKPSRAVRGILKDKRTQEALGMAGLLEVEHPKMDRLVELVLERKGKQLIVFVQYRSQIDRVVEELNKIEGVKAVRFVGKREGVTQKEQKETIERFRNREFNVLVASSVGEEGLDIPSVDCVIFYEPIPSEIRSIQRRGRAGRAKIGEVIILITEGTRDESYYWASVAKERRMRKIIKRLSRGKLKRKPAQAKLTEF